MAPEPEAAGARRARRLLAAAGAAGLALALWSALGAPAPELAARGAAATVNGVAIPRAELARAVEAIAADKQGPVTEVERRRALDTLVREELLVQRAEAIGLLRDDRSVRKAAVQAMLRVIVAEARAEPPDEARLRAFYAEHPELGGAGARLHVRAASVGTAAEARRLAERIREGASFGAAVAEAGAVRAPAPDGLVPFAKLADYVGGRLARAALALEEGEIAGPVEAGGRHHLLWLVRREGSERPDFAALRDVVERAYRRRREERAVREYLERLRGRAEVRVAEEALERVPAPADVEVAGELGEAPEGGGAR